MYKILINYGDEIYTLLDTAIDMARAMQIAQDKSRDLDRDIEIWDEDIVQRYTIVARRKRRLYSMENLAADSLGKARDEWAEFLEERRSSGS